MGDTVRRFVIDTNVVVAGLRSRRGAAFRVLEEVGRGRFEIALSVPLVLEYEEVLHRHAAATGLTRSDVEAVVNYFCSVGHRQVIFFLWRPFLSDPNDDHLLELAVAVAAGCEGIVTYNVRDLVGVEQFGIKVLEPGAFLKRIGVLK